VVQSDLFNQTRIATTLVVSLTSTPRLDDLPGNVHFAMGEANLPKACTANVTQVATLDRSRLREKIGVVSQDKLEAVLKGLHLVMWGDELKE
jgi:mRNA interferase MazF